MRTDFLETEEVHTAQVMAASPASIPIKFDLTSATIEARRLEAESLTIAGPDDKAGYKKLTRYRLDVIRPQRFAVEDKIEALIRSHLDYVRRVREIGSPLVLALKGIENGCYVREKAHEDELERIADEEATAARIRYDARTRKLRSMGYEYDAITDSFGSNGDIINVDDIRSLPDEEYEIIECGAAMAYRVEQDRLAEIALAKRLDDERIAKEQQAEADRLTAERLQLEQQQAELKRQQEAIQQKEREMDAERKRIDDLNRAEFARQQEAKEQIEWDRQYKEKEKAEALAEKARSKADRERTARLKPDKKEINLFFTRMLNTKPWPELEQVETIDFMAVAYDRIRTVVDGVRAELDAL